MKDPILNRHIVISEDGSPTLFSETFGESYHSTSGAVQESIHLFINNGLIKAAEQNIGEIHILEYGFGTGLNALLTIQTLLNNRNLSNTKVYYTSIEKYPLTEEEYSHIDYSDKEIFLRMHQTKWQTLNDFATKEHFNKITEQFYIRKIEADFADFHPFQNKEWIDVIYFDPFSPETQPQSWNEETFGRIFKAIKPSGRLVTYSAKGIVKQALRSCGFEVTRIKGAGKKRHSLVALKNRPDTPENQPLLQ